MNSFFASLLVLDLELFRNSLTIVSPEYARLIQVLGEVVVVAGAVFLVGLWIAGARKKDIKLKIAALSIFFTIALTFIAYAIVNLGIPAFRPGAMTISGSSALIPHPTDNSFPSGHALFVGALLVGLWRYYRRGGVVLVFVVLATITLFARVVGGVHYPGDIIGWLIIGSLVALFLKPATEWLVEKTSPLFLRVAKVFHL